MARSVDGPSQLRHLLALGRSGEALDLAERTLDDDLPSAPHADVLLLRLAALINLGRRGEFTGALDAAADAVRASPDPERYGQLYTLSAIVASLDDSLDRCVTYLVKSWHALGSVSRVGRDIACAWHDLAMAYSYAGLHGHALSAIERARHTALAAGVAEADFVVPAIRVRLAVWHDHHGDTDACVRVLRDVVAELPWHAAQFPDGRAGIRPISLAAYGYASARLAALGEGPEPAHARDLLAAGGAGRSGHDLRLLGEVCLLIASGAAAEALARLDGTRVAPMTLGEPEPQRLRALAYLAAGAAGAAHTADRRAFRIASARLERLRELYVDAVSARIEVREPLTELVSARDFDEQVASLRSSGQRGVLAVYDLDGPVDDPLLQRVADVLLRVMRRGDAVTRYSGSRFAVLLPGAGADEAREVTARIQATMAAEESSVPLAVTCTEIGAPAYS